MVWEGLYRGRDREKMYLCSGTITLRNNTFENPKCQWIISSIRKVKNWAASQTLHSAWCYWNRMVLPSNRHLPPSHARNCSLDLHKYWFALDRIKHADDNTVNLLWHLKLTSLNTRVEYIDEIISIGSSVLVPESHHVSQFVNHDSELKTEIYRYLL